jgi:hypothetical protein
VVARAAATRVASRKVAAKLDTRKVVSKIQGTRVDKIGEAASKAHENRVGNRVGKDKEVLPVIKRKDQVRVAFNSDLINNCKADLNNQSGFTIIYLSPLFVCFIG